jgi:uncharacterized membrane protein YkoI
MKRISKYAFALTFIFTSVSIALADDDDAAIAQLIMKKSGITSMVALEKVKMKYPAGIIYNYELEDDDDQFFHEIKFVNLADNQKYEINVDAKTGEIVNAKSTSATSIFNFGGKLADAETISKSGFQMSDAIKKINLEENMVITDIEFDEEHGVQFFEIEAYGPQGKRKWLIDLENKSLIPTLNNN